MSQNLVDYQSQNGAGPPLCLGAREARKQGEWNVLREEDQGVSVGGGSVSLNGWTELRVRRLRESQRRGQENQEEKESMANAPVWNWSELVSWKFSLAFFL